ncbi:MAG: hypothetical protein PHF67_00660 [Candidatus Nanoarchaeia archaeon]|nr:hypothetical protein [Candidatus Nanoarchaeia archaeon]
MNDQNPGELLFRDFLDEESGPGVFREVVTLPRSRVTIPEYVARVLVNRTRFRKIDEATKRFDKYLDYQSGTDEYSSGVVKLLRGLFDLDEEKERYGREEVPDRIPPEKLQGTLVCTFLDNVMSYLTNSSHSYHHFEVLYDRFVEASTALYQGEVRFARKSLQGENLAALVSGYGHDLDTALEEWVRRRSEEKLSILDCEVSGQLIQVGELLIQKFPLLRNRRLREEIVDHNDLCNTLCSAVVHDLLDEPFREQFRLSEIVRMPEIPSRLKILYSMKVLGIYDLTRAGADLLKLNLLPSDGKPE